MLKDADLSSDTVSTLVDDEGNPVLANDGSKVTSQCIMCRSNVKDAMLNSTHWNWRNTAQDRKAIVTSNDPDVADSTEIGKENVINNFCIAIRGNWQRCTTCHTGCGWGCGWGAGGSGEYDFTNASNIDCLSCHAAKDSGYKKTFKNTKGPQVAPSIDLNKAAVSAGKSTRESCGGCHFNAGGGSNVKLMGQFLANPTIESDAHMGGETGMVCADCHYSGSHNIKGVGVYLPGGSDRVLCQDCHSVATGFTHNNNSFIDKHIKKLACETCHIPSFARTTPNKTWWDWSYTGNRSRGTNNGSGHYFAFGNAVDARTGEYDENTNVKTYFEKKGVFGWEHHKRPTYAWFDGNSDRMTVNSTFAQGLGTELEPVVLGRPNADINTVGAKIYPFKVMNARQPLDPVRGKALLGQLFYGNGLWGNIPTEEAWTEAGCDDKAAADCDLMKDLWTAKLNLGSFIGGQSPENYFTGMAEYPADCTWDVARHKADSSIPLCDAAPVDAVTGQWVWGYTELWMNMNHEITKSEVLMCGDCHGNVGFDYCALGYPTTNPADPEAATCN